MANEYIKRTVRVLETGVFAIGSIWGPKAVIESQITNNSYIYAFPADGEGNITTQNGSLLPDVAERLVNTAAGSECKFKEAQKDLEEQFLAACPTPIDFSSVAIYFGVPGQDGLPAGIQQIGYGNLIEQGIDPEKGWVTQGETFGQTMEQMGQADAAKRQELDAERMATATAAEKERKTEIIETKSGVEFSFRILPDQRDFVDMAGVKVPIQAIDPTLAFGGPNWSCQRSGTDPNNAFVKIQCKGSGEFNISDVANSILTSGDGWVGQELTLEDIITNLRATAITDEQKLAGSGPEHQQSIRGIMPTLEAANRKVEVFELPVNSENQSIRINGEELPGFVLSLMINTLNSGGAPNCTLLSLKSLEDAHVKQEVVQVTCMGGGALEKLAAMMADYFHKPEEKDAILHALSTMEVIQNNKGLTLPEIGLGLGVMAVVGILGFWFTKRRRR